MGPHIYFSSVSFLCMILFCRSRHLCTYLTIIMSVSVVTPQLMQLVKTAMLLCYMNSKS